MKASIEWENVPMNEVRELLQRFVSFLAVQRREVGMEVQGTFVDDNGDLVFLDNKPARVDPLTVSNFDIHAYVDGEWSQLQPADDRSRLVVKLCYPWTEDWDQTW